MSIRNLECEVKRRVEEAIKGIQLIDSSGQYVTPLVSIGALPQELVKGKPYILIQTINIIDLEQESSAEINVLYGTIAGTNEDLINKGDLQSIYSYGHWDVISVIDKLRINFLKDVNFNFGILNRDIKHEVFGEVRFPNYLGETKLKFTVVAIMPEDEYL